MNQAFLAKITIIKVFPCRGEHVRTYISGSRCAWWQKTTNRHTHKHGTTTVTLDACIRAAVFHPEVFARGGITVCSKF